MIPGPTIIRKCPDCSGLIEQGTIVSGNTFLAIFWTDGKMDALMMPDQPRFVKCPHCQALVWINELEEVGRVEPIIGDQVYENAKSYDLPDIQDYLLELRRRDYDRKKEQYLRVRAWWAGNDKRRYEGERTQALSGDEIENMQALYDMLDPSDDNDRLMMAEIKRELGQFEEAEIHLKKPFASEFSKTVSAIGQLVQRQDPFVAEIQFED